MGGAFAKTLRVNSRGYEMIIFDEDRPSDSPFVERVWRCHSEGAAPFLSIAASRCEDAALQGHLQDRDLRTIQRRFLRATGLTQSAARQIERARYATHLLQQGVSILDTVLEAGYFDQPHLTRSLKSLIGQTPTQIREKSRPEQMPFLYKTTPFG